ncbi:hypothetical protein EIN_235390 [Entamoeba invadens IP1]|uniref:Uncharacterized protein n=1 Tax=Entamoeba invadens IP1 TaxID=370355 RepID=L7FKQ4_ENTIV|nr:hypothetical protein EIN_235390 [Entamoeba invadens IP1]ELP86022.1 hypothetical protein EIN_235390 [Entamoeba invadens IP1]|eukprot:XP_004185368.1 hypothetical protein EIN_235390 [Entamoeba invadens IP1]
MIFFHSITSLKKCYNIITEIYIIFDFLRHILIYKAITKRNANANAIIFFYSVNKKETFELLEHLVNEIKLNIHDKDNVNIVKFIICGTRNDLISQRVVSKIKAVNFAKQNGCVYVEIGEQVNPLTNVLIEEVFNLYNQNSNDEPKILTAAERDKEMCPIF